jgi:Uma2 family endonuclease
MSVQTKLMTVEEFVTVPDPTEGHNELHHGEIVIMPPPKRGHQIIQDRLQTLLKMLLGDRFVVHMEMAFRPAPEHEVWVADVGGVSRERHKVTGNDDYLMGSPDLVIEVLSPSNTMQEIDDKTAICMDNGCVSFWVVIPKSKTVSVREGTVTKHYAVSDLFSCALLKEPIKVQEIFE